ncbi:DNA recombination protein RmuC [Aquihabitans sp. G128]|uniref:DNA recombination protein RmuC n=1 Tax=Aquihabitans sp. G128 TaxID=2849779 RepID=UPI001C21AA91|nr:DNA recombination protein RmuC [Aquihabitans sp. G128]QXC60992.1 DNA recombination protein RmuC [Aquihabitans sp. G128]
MDLATIAVALFAALVAAALVAAVAVAVVRSPVAGAAGSHPTPPVVGPELLAQHRAEVRHQLDRVADLVMGLSDRQVAQHGEVSASLTEALRATAGLADTTAHLREALASPKARGQWGERMADDVLRLAGFVEGVNYRRQVALPGGTIPDVTFLLPGDLVLHMDVKFPLDNYLRASNAETLGDRTAAEAAFLRDVRQRVKELAGRGYVQPGVTVDHVLLFIPNESVYGFVHQHDPGLADLALRQKVVLCSPFTLFAVLGVIRQSVEAHEVSRASDEILQCLAGFGEQWTRFSDALDVVAKRFDTAQRGLEELAGPRRRQLERQLDRLEDLRTRRGLAAEDAAPAAPRLAPVDRAG